MAALRQRGFEPEYFAIRQAADLGKVRTGARDLVILAAARLNSHRLTDNLRVRVIDRY
jgi:pantoate--beta-alanine ligase